MAAPNFKQKNSAPCPWCGTTVEWDQFYLEGQDQDIFACARPLCDECEAKSDLLTKKSNTSVDQWKRRLPTKYHEADVSRVPAHLQRALSWTRATYPNGLGITGRVGIGKSMALALALLGYNFRWITGTALRELAITASTAEGEERLEARARWNHLLNSHILVIDDLDKAKFTEAWCSKLFELLEYRTGNLLPTFWSANHHPGPDRDHLSQVIGRQSGDFFQGDAIERRLVQEALVVSSTTNL